MKAKVVQIRHTPTLSWPAIVDPEGVRVLLIPTEHSEDGKSTGDKARFADMQIPAIAQQMLDSRGTLPTLFFSANLLKIEFGWLTSWNSWEKNKDEKQLTYGDCEDWLCSVCHEFLETKPINLEQIIKTSALFCAMEDGAALPAWSLRRDEQIKERRQRFDKIAREKLSDMLVEMAHSQGHFAEA